MAAGWAGLPKDLLVLIAKCVKVMEDYIAFRGVCTSWRTASPKDNFNVISPQLPLLMLPHDDDDYREFYSLSKGKVSHKLYLPEAKGRECLPSHQVGWLLPQSFHGKKVNLLNPFSRTQIQLPNRFTLIDEDEDKVFFQLDEYNYVRNVVLSANPSFTSDYVLVIAYNTDVNHFAFWRPGDINWTKFDLDYRVGGVSDMIYFKGQFYLVTWSGELGIIDIQGPNSVPESNIIYLNDDKLFQQYLTQFYLVDVNDALSLVARFGRRRSNASRVVETVKFEVYELDVVEGNMKEINNLGDSTIFVGRNGTTSIDSTKFTGVIKPNHIYFTDDWFDHNYRLECGGGKDMGCYNLQDGNIESFYPKLSLRPTWVIPG